MERSRFKDRDIPDVPLHHLVFNQAEKRGNETVWINGENGKSYTLAETKQFSLKISKVLEDRGLKKGDVLALYLHNCPEFAFILYGCMALGVIATTVSTAYAHEEVYKQIKGSGATYIFTNDELAPKAKNAAEKSGQILEIFTTGISPGCVPFDQFTSYSGPEFDWERVEINPNEDVVLIPYSSGTTGLPKGVLLTHKNLVFSIAVTFNDDMLNKSSGPDGQDHLLLVLPMFHMYGIFLLCGSIARADKIITMKRFLPNDFMKNIEKYQISDLFLVPPLVIFMNKSPLAQKHDMSSVRRVICAAAPLSKESELEFRKLYPQVNTFGQGYGMTELGPIATFNPALAAKMGSIGVIVSNVELRVVDTSDGKALGAGEMGELWVRSAGVMKGYLNNPEATSKTVDEDGWLHTGDIGYYDEEGYYFVIDRLKELIKVKAFQVAPAELEALLLEHPGIADAAVTSVPDEKSGELPVGFVVLKKGVELSEKEVQQFVADKAARYKQLKGGVKFLEQIPKSPSGKILRRLLRVQLREGEI